MGGFEVIVVVMEIELRNGWVVVFEGCNWGGG